MSDKKSKRAEELMQEIFTPFGEGKTCEGCIFCEGNTPFDNAPDKCSCDIYSYPKTKPDSVFLEGKPCKYKRTRE